MLTILNYTITSFYHTKNVLLIPNCKTANVISFALLTKCRPNGMQQYWPTACCPWWVTLHMRVLQTTTDDDDRRQRPLLVWSRYTMCRWVSNNSFMNKQQTSGQIMFDEKQHHMCPLLRIAWSPLLHAITDNWTIPFVAATPKAFQRARQPPKNCPFLWGISDPYEYGSLGPPESATQTIPQLI